MDITLHQLRCFVAVTEHLHFARAAESLRLSPSTLSEQIATLERALDRRLFERSSRSVRLTAEGEELVPLARDALAAADAVLRWGRGPQETILTVGTTGSSPGLRAILHAAADRLPSVRLRLQPVGFTGGVPALRSREVDCAFIFGLPSDAAPDGLRVAELWTERLLVAMPDAHRLSERDIVGARDLWGETLIGPSESPAEGGAPWGDWYAAIDPSIPEHCAIRSLVSSVDETMELVAAGIGLNIAGASAVASYPRPGLRFVPLDTELEVRALLAWRDERPESALAEFVWIARSATRGRAAD